MKWTNEPMSNFNISKFIKIILKVAAGIIQFAVVLFFVIGLFSAATVVVNFVSTIQPEKAIFNYSDTTNVSLSIPFYFNNTGLYDVDELTFTIDLDLFNETDTFNVLNGSVVLPTIPAGNDLNTTVRFDNGVIEPNLLAGMMSNPTGYNMTLYAGIDGKYLFGLVPFGMNINATNLPFNMGM
jgi:hypothetical protein